MIKGQMILDNRYLPFPFTFYLQADWMLWPAAQAINFRLLSPRYRVVYVASVTCVWNSFLSFMKHVYKVALYSVITFPSVLTVRRSTFPLKLHISSIQVSESSNISLLFHICIKCLFE